MIDQGQPPRREASRADAVALLRLYRTAARSKEPQATLDQIGALWASLEMWSGVFALLRLADLLLMVAKFEGDDDQVTAWLTEMLSDELAEEAGLVVDLDVEDGEDHWIIPPGGEE